MSRKKITVAIAAIAVPAGLSLTLAVAPASASPCAHRAHAAPSCFMTPSTPHAASAEPDTFYHS
jgi:hypothetical protein